MLQNTKSGLLKRLARFFTGALSDDFYDELEEALNDITIQPEDLLPSSFLVNS